MLLLSPNTKGAFMRNRKARNRRKMAIRTITKLIAERRQEEEDGILSAAKQKDGRSD